MTIESLVKRNTGLCVLTGLIPLIVSNVLHAQAAQVGQSAASASTSGPAAVESLQEVVVTGTAMPQGRKKLDASFSVTTADLTEIRDANPSSSADLLKIVPGLWAETSGGVSGANIEVAGFPGGGDAPYVTWQLQGSPVYPVPSLSFMDNSVLFRLDDTVERAEVVQGGPSVVYSNGQLGATANMVLRQGTEDPHGDIGLTVGSEHLYRVDGFYGGPLTQDWFFSIGGFYRYSDGIRDPGYPADVGGQLTATLSHKFQNGSILFFVRELNDKNLLITDIPVTVSGSGTSQTISPYPGFNAYTGTFAGNGLRGISVQEAPGAPPLTADLADGRGPDIHMFGNDVDLQVTPQIAFANKAMYTGGQVTCYCLFNNFAPQTLSSYIAQEITAVNGNSAITGTYGPATSGTAQLVSTGAPVDPNSYVASLGFWIVRKQIQSFTDDMRFSFDLTHGNTVTVGGYLATYSSDDQWWLGNNELVTAVPNSQLVSLTLNNGANVTNSAGLLGASFYTLLENWSGVNTALFASDQWKIGAWLLDAGYRIEEQKDNGSIENDSSVNLDNNPLDLYNKGVSVPNGTFNQGVSCDTSGSNQCTRFQHTLGSWTVGVNYELTPHMSVYGRVNHGVHFPGFDDLRSGTPQTQSVENYEVGYRAQTQTIYGVVDVWRRTFTGVPYQAFTATGQQQTATYGASSYGLDIEGRWEPIQYLSFDLTGNWQHDVYTNFASATVTGVDYTGLTLQRQPRLQFRLTPAYEIPVAWGDLRIFATYSYIGLRYSDIANQQILPSYYTLDAGVVTEIGESFEVRLQGTNLTDQIGLTEGNARIALGAGSGILGSLELGRPIFGREVSVQVRYKF